MKSVLSLIVCAFFVLALASTAQSKDAQANGDFDFSVEGATGSVVFDANGDESGVTGQMTFNATVVVGTEDGEGTTTANVAIAAQFDCMLVDDNKAALSGAITSSNIPLAYPVGQPVTLFVVDKVAGISPTVDGFAWGVYKLTPNLVNLKQSTENDSDNGNRYKGKDYDFCPDPTPPVEGEEFPTIASDCEGQECFPPPAPACMDDPGLTLTWVSADAERYPCTLPEGYPDVPPVCPTPDPNGSTAGLSTLPAAVTCESFPLSAYPLTFVDGNKIQVKNHP
jgi:hypothetical protein